MWDKMRNAFGKKPQKQVNRGIPIMVPKNIADMYAPLPDIELPDWALEDYVEPCECENSFKETGIDLGVCEICGSNPAAASAENNNSSIEDSIEVEESVEDISEPSPRPRRAWIDEDEDY